MMPEDAFPERIVYYWSRVFQMQLAEGDDYALLRPTISICFLNHQLFPAVPDHQLRFRLVEERHRVTFTDILEIHIIELPKFRATPQLMKQPKPLDRWLYLLQNAATLDADNLPAWLAVEEIKRAMNEAKQIAESQTERERYEARWKAQHDEISRVRIAERRGRAEGRAEAEIEMIHLCQRCLGEPVTPQSELDELQPDALHQLAAQWQQRLLEQVH